MPTLFVTGGCGFIGSNFIRHLLDDRPGRPRRQLRRPDLRRQPRQPRRRRRPPALPVRQGRHHRPRRRSARPWPGRRRDVINFAAESHVDRSIHDSRAVRPHQRRSARRSCSTPPASSSVPTLRAGLDRRGVRQPRADRALHRGDAAGPEQPVLGQQGGRRPAGAGVRTTRSACPRSSRAARTTTGRTSSPRS